MSYRTAVHPQLTFCFYCVFWHSFDWFLFWHEFYIHQVLLQGHLQHSHFLLANHAHSLRASHSPGVEDDSSGGQRAMTSAICCFMDWSGWHTSSQFYSQQAKVEETFLCRSLHCSLSVVSRTDCKIALSLGKKIIKRYTLAHTHGHTYTHTYTWPHIHKLHMGTHTHIYTHYTWVHIYTHYI